MRFTTDSGELHLIKAGNVRPTHITRIGRCVLLVLALVLAACGAPEAPAPAEGPSAAPAPAASVAPAATAVVDARTALALANAAFRENRVVAPAGNNALEHALHALQQEPNNVGATEILVDLTPIAAASIEADIAAGNFAEAERVMALLTQANSGSLTVQGLQRRLATATRPLVAPPPPVAEPPAAPTQAAATAAAVPAATTNRDAAPPPAAPQPASATARSASAPGSTTGRSEPAAAVTAPAVASAPPPAAPAPAPTPTSSRTSEPVPLVKVSPEYPAAAKKRRTEGWVELQFIVGIDGVPRQIEVIRAQPPGMFDRSAIRAMTRWKFKPAERDGQPVEARAKTTVGFKLG